MNNCGGGDETAKASYREDYLQWKDWGETSFGAVRSVDSAYFAAELRRTKRRFPSRSKVLEIGFGNGRFLKFATDRGWDIIGTELNSALVEVASLKGFNVMHCSDLQDFPAHSFDLVVAFDVLEHLPNDLLSAMMAQIRRVLKEDGVLVARFPNGDSPFGLAYQNGDMTHLSAIGSGKIRFLAGAADMEVVHIGAESQPILCGSVPHFFQRLIAMPFKLILDLAVRFIFFPTLRVSFSSPNMSVVLRPTCRK
jgi:SAM-dependent methyltransferase